MNDIEMNEELARRLNAVESENAIRRLMAEYLESPDVRQDGAHNASLFTADGIWDGVGGFAEGSLTYVSRKLGSSAKRTTEF